MISTKAILVLSLLIISFNGISQRTDLAKNKSLYAELGGAAIAFSLNFDQRFTKSASGFGYRVGTGFYPQSKFNQSTVNPGFVKIFILTIPAQINYVLQIKDSPSSIEAGLGLTFTSKRVEIFDTDGGSEHSYFTAALMYRRIPTNGRHINWRVGFTPFYNSDVILLSAGASIGYQF